MEILKKLYLLLIVPALTGCYEDINPDITVKPVLCLNSLITAGQPIEVAVTHTWLFTDEKGENDHEVKDAVVSVYVNGKLQDDDCVAQEGDRVRIEAFSPTYGVAEAEVTVPRSPVIESVEWTSRVSDIWKDSVPGWNMLLDMTFNTTVEMTVSDVEQIDNYYMFSYSVVDPYGDYSINSGRFYQGTFQYESEPIFSEHIGVFESVMGIDSSGFTFFTDRQFSGKSYTLHLQFNDMSYYVNHTDYDEELLDCGFVLTLSSVSKSFYNWANYRWQIENGMVGDLGEIGLGDAIWGYSNVSTGAGVVAAQANSTSKVSLKNFLEQHINNN